MWTLDQYGEPFCWQHPSHRKPQGFDKKQRAMTPAHRSMIAAELYLWFSDAVAFFSEDNWTFGVDRKGNYTAPKHRKAPADFEFTEGAWSLRLSVFHPTERKPRTSIELTMRREQLHKAVTVILMNLIGSTKTNQWLTPERKEFRLPKLKKPELLGKQKLLW